MLLAGMKTLDTIFVPPLHSRYNIIYILLLLFSGDPTRNHTAAVFLHISNLIFYGV